MATGDDRIGTLFWELTLKDERFNKKVKDAENSLEELDDNGGSSLTSLANSFNEITDAAGKVLSSFKSLSVDQIEIIAQQKIMADSIGATTGEIVGLTNASERLVGDAGMVLDKMREFGGIDEFKALADDVKNAGTETEQLAKAVELFGGEGAKMLPVLQLGSDGLKEFEDQALATGEALSPEDTEKATEAYRQWQELTGELTGMSRQLGVALSGLIPIIREGVSEVRDMVTATGEVIDGFRIWRDEVLGIEDPFSKAVTAEEILARKTELATREIEKQKNALDGLTDQSEKTFSSDLFMAEHVQSSLKELQELLPLSEEGFRKIAGMAGGALSRGETVEDIAAEVRDLMALTSASFFKDEDFQMTVEKVEKEVKDADLGIFGDLDNQEAELNKVFDKQRDKMKEIMQQQADAPQFAQMATRGSVAEFKILQQNDKKTEKSIERNTKRVADLIAKWETV
jgi:hypothetical protein